MKIQIIYLLLSFVLTAILGKIIIPILKKLKVGQSEREDGPRSHLRKQGTPTMGGIMMIISIIIFTTIACILNPEKEFLVPNILVKGYKEQENDSLYFEATNDYIEATLKFIPYFAYENRGETDVLIWVLKKWGALLWKNL